MFLPYAIRELRLTPALVGLTLSALGVGGLIGAVLANRFIRRYRLGRVYVAARVVSGVGSLLLPLAAGPTVATVVICMVSFFIWQGALACGLCQTDGLASRRADRPDLNRVPGREGGASDQHPRPAPSATTNACHAVGAIACTRPRAEHLMKAS